MGNPVEQAIEHDDVERPAEPLMDSDDEQMIMQNVCIHCGRMGETRLQTRHLPHLPEGLMVMAFQCLLCGLKNDEVQFAGQYGEQGVRYTLTIPAGGGPTLARQLLKSEIATVTIPEMEFEIPGSLVDCTHLTRGDLTTVEGLLRSTVANLQLNQSERAPEVAAAIQECIEELLRCAGGEQAFTLTMDDPSGNSYISALPEAAAEGGGEAGAAAQQDPQLQVERYERTPQQQAGLGLEGAPPAEP